FTASLVRALFYGTKSNCTSAPGSANCCKICNIGIHTYNGRPTALVFKLGHSKLVKPNFSAQLVICTISNTQHDGSNVTETWVSFYSYCQRVLACGNSSIKLVLLIEFHLCWIGTWIISIKLQCFCFHFLQ